MFFLCRSRKLASKIGKGTEVGVRRGKDRTSSNIFFVTQKRFWKMLS